MRGGLWKRGLLLFLPVVIVICCCACFQQEQGDKNDVPETKLALPTIPSATTPPVTNVTPAEDPMKQAYGADPAAFVLFYRSTEPQEVYVPLEDIMAYDSLYPECNSTWYRDRLEGEDLGIYNSYLYAMEHCFTGFELYVEDNDVDFSPVRQAISLDSPFLAQNTSRYETIMDWPSDYIGERIHISIDHFSEERWGMKMDALAECLKIVEGIPAECTTQLEKMEHLYRYVCDHVEYVAYGEMVDEDYLHDAVFQGETVCDGYSNMLLLLYRLIGVECCEVMGSNFEDFDQLSPEEQANAVGHTWVVAKVDGQFYHFDPTYEDTKASEWENDTVFFGFSDALVDFKYMELDQYRPKCTDPSMDFPYADLELSGFGSADVKEIADVTKERAEQGKKTTVIAIREPLTEEKYDKMIEKYWEYVKGIGRINVSYVEIGSCTLLWMTVKT